MSLSHKAYVFDHASFSAELKPMLEDAVRTQNPAELRQFISDQRSLLTDPYEGLPLDEDWEMQLEFRSPDEYGDIALTKYYDPRMDVGLGQQWEEISNWLRMHARLATDPTLGSTVGTGNALFDPGKMGSYFQSTDDVSQNLRHLQQLAAQYSVKSDFIESILTLLQHAAQVGKGLYITF